MPLVLSRLIPRSRGWRIALVILALLGVVGGVWAYKVLRVEPIPEQLEEMEETPDSIVLESLSETPDLVLGEQRGFKSFYVIVGMRTPKKEGVALNRALNRWQYPTGVKGYIVGDAEGAGMFRGMAKKMLDFFRKEARFPIFVDFAGAMLRVFKLPKGHHGFVVLGEDGEVLVRKSGGIEGAELEDLRVLLGAELPPPPPAAPEFAVAGLTKASCADKPCALIFLGAPVKKVDVPGIEGGFDGSTTDGMDRMNKPEIRLAASAVKMDLKGAHGAVIGDVDFPIPGWTVLAEAAEARAVFGLAPDDTAMVIVDEQGRLALREVGLVPMWVWGEAADLLHAEIMPGDED